MWHGRYGQNLNQIDGIRQKSVLVCNTCKIRRCQAAVGDVRLALLSWSIRDIEAFLPEKSANLALATGKRSGPEVHCGDELAYGC